MHRYILTLLASCLFFSATATEENAQETFTLQHFAAGETQTVTAEDFSGQFLLIAFGFTTCPDVCPTTLFKMGQLLRAPTLQDQPLQPIFITIDPLRDTPEKLAQYVHYFHPRIVGLTGSLAEIERVAKSLGATFGYRYQGKIVRPPNLPIGYSVFHSNYLYLLSPQGQLIDAFDFQLSGRDLADHIAQAIKNNNKDNEKDIKK